MSIPVFVISLRRRTDRRAWITEHLQHVGLPFTFFDATDAQELSQDPLAQLFDVARVRELNPGCSELETGAIACSLSHYRLWQQVAASRASWTLILEDDAEFTVSNPNPLLESIAAAAGPHDLVLLNSRCNGVWRRGPVRFRPGSHTMYRVNAETRLSAGYLLSVGAAQRLSAAVARDGFRCIVDWWYSRIGADWSQLLPIRVVKPDLVVQCATLGSDIVTEQNNYFSWVHDDTHRDLPLFTGLVRKPKNPRFWPQLATRLLRRVYASYCVPPRCLE